MPAAIPCHCHALRQTTRTLTHYYDSALAPAGLTTPQFALLRTIERTGPSSITSVARKLGLDRTTLGRNLRPLIEAGYVSMAEEARDGRERLVSVTDAGSKAIGRAAPLWKQTQDRLSAKMGADKLQLLRTLLAELEFTAR